MEDNEGAGRWVVPVSNIRQGDGYREGSATSSPITYSNKNNGRSS
jgi:hypothetical protein